LKTKLQITFLNTIIKKIVQVGALKRRIALLEEETARSSARLKENMEKITSIEKVSLAK